MDTERIRRHRLAEQLMDTESVAGLIAYGEAADFFAGAAVDALVLLSRGRSPTVLVGPGRWPVPPAPWLAAADVREGLHAYGIADALDEHDLDRSTVGVIGIEAFSPLHRGATMPYTLWAEVLRLVPTATFVPVWRPFLMLTLARSDEELGELAAAATVGETAARTMVARLRSGESAAEAGAAARAASGGRASVSCAPYGDGTVLAEVVSGTGRGAVQHLAAITARGAGNPAVDRAAAAAQSAYAAGVRLMRAGTPFGEVAKSMRLEIAGAGGTHRTPQISSVPAGIVGGCGPDLPTIGYDVALTPGMVFTVAATCQIGTTAVRLGGTVVIGADSPIELAPFTRRLIHI